jgi:hypothetical protein
MPPIDIAPPSPDVLANLLDEHAARFPEKATLHLTGLSVPIILANPKPKSAAFDDAIAAALNFRPQADPTGEQLVKECLLWPRRPDWQALRARYAAVDAQVSKALGNKLGSRLSVVRAPEDDEKQPEGITPSAVGVWRILEPHGWPAIHVAIEPPDETKWRMFVNEATKPGADLVANARDMASACITGSSMPLAEMFDRWPGLVVACIAVIAQLAGAGASVSLGEW